MTQTTTSTQDITETVAIERFGGDVYTWKGENVQPSSGGSSAVNSTTAQFEIIDTALPWQLEIISRDAGIVETEDINRTISVQSTTETLSVFSQ